MKIFIYLNSSPKTINKALLFEALHEVASTTDTSNLVVSLYVLLRSWSGGVANVRQWVTPNRFCAPHGKWAFTQQFSTPASLPAKFKLIRMLLRGDPREYPLIERDGYGWQHRYGTLYDHLALLFAHELHHYRRYHLGLHPREGEHSANRWAVEHVSGLGFSVQSHRLPKRKRRRRPRRLNVVELFNPLTSPMFKKLPAISNTSGWQRIVTNATLRLQTQSPQKLLASQTPHFEKLRSLPAGTKLQVAFDPTGKYQNSLVQLIRPMRRDSIRIVVETHDGKQWRWPMAWLEEL